MTARPSPAERLEWVLRAAEGPMDATLLALRAQMHQTDCRRILNEWAKEGRVHREDRGPALKQFYGGPRVLYRWKGGQP